MAASKVLGLRSTLSFLPGTPTGVQQAWTGHFKLGEGRLSENPCIVGEAGSTMAVKGCQENSVFLRVSRCSLRARAFLLSLRLYTGGW